MNTNTLNPGEVKAVVLAGGSGTRLWPLSRQQLPKQFLSLDGKKGLLDTTIDRLQPLLSLKDVLVVTNQQHAFGEAYQTLNRFDTLLEPVGRNTAPAIALAAAWLLQFSDHADPVMIVLPADHVIRKEAEFLGVLEEGVKLAQQGALVTLGIEPTRPDTGFGYIKAIPAEQNGARSYRVEKFAEKPDEETAQQYLDEGCYHWNSGMFVWKASTILAEVKRYLPECHAVLEKITSAWANGDDYQQAVNEYFDSMPGVSIDYGVLEKTAGPAGNLYVIPCDIAWSDVGSWDAVHEILDQDEQGNAMLGNVINVDSKDTLVHANNRLVAVLGVEDLCIVETADAVLVSRKGETQRVREVVDELKELDAPERLLHLTVNRPWGSYTVLESQPGFKMKRITVNPGSQLSLQRHQHRSEHWIVVSGTATVSCDDEVMTVTKNQSTYIPVGSKHRLENRGRIPLQLIEVQVGEYLEEDDIERYDDDFGRATEN